MSWYVAAKPLVALAELQGPPPRQNPRRGPSRATSSLREARDGLVWHRTARTLYRLDQASGACRTLTNHRPDLIPTDGTVLEEQRRLRVLTLVTVCIVAMAPFFVYQYYELGVPSVSVAVVITLVASLLSLGWARRQRNSRLGGWIATSLLLGLLVFSNLQSGGFYDPNFGWLYVFPMLAALLVDARAGWVFTGLVLLLTLAFWLAPESGIVIPNRIPAEHYTQQSLANRVSAVVAIGVILAAIASQQRFSRQMLKRSNQDLQAEIDRRFQMQQRLVRTERAASMGNLAAGLAHEINNPLTYVIGNLELLNLAFEDTAETEDRVPREESLRLLEEALEGASRVADLVRDLKNFSRVDEAEFRPVSLAHAIDGASRLVANELRHRARLEVECDPNLYVFGNEGRLQQVLVNLMVNAAHATKIGTADEHLVRLCALRTEDEIVLEISDTGSGIPAEVLDKIFEPFFTTKAEGHGIGMGLFITSNVVQSLGGRVEVESTVGVGTTFSIFLPEAEAPARSAELPRPTAGGSAAARTLQILAIDDEEPVLVYLRRALAHHHLTTETNPHTALERILEGSEDVILCDLMMPDMTGMDLYREVQKSRPDVAERMVFMTAGTFADEGRDFLRAIPGRWIEKPLRITDLEALIYDRVRAVEEVP